MLSFTLLPVSHYMTGCCKLNIKNNMKGLLSVRKLRNLLSTQLTQFSKQRNRLIFLNYTTVQGQTAFTLGFVVLNQLQTPRNK